MMYCSSSIILLLLVVVAVSASVVQGSEFHAHVTFNDGNSDSTKDCSGSEFRNILAIVTNATTTRRSLRTTTAQQQQRHLAKACGCRLCIFSGRGCAGKTTDECDGDCDRRSRSLATHFSRRAQSNTTTTNTPCDAEIQVINATLNTVPNLSSKCRALINSKRTFTCRKEVPCEIAQISVWNTETQTMITNHLPPEGVDVCYSTRPTLDAMPVFDMGHVDFRLDGVSSAGTTVTHYKREWKGPYVMFGNSGSYYNNMQEHAGMDLPVGTYTVKIYVDDIANSKIIKLTVSDC